MYMKHWGFSRLPFENVPDPEFFFEAEQFRESLARLTYVAGGRKGAAVLIGDIGCGKTTLSRKFVQALSPERYDVALIVSPSLSPQDFMREILYQFDLSCHPSSSKSQMRQTLDKHFYKNFDRGRDTLVIIDEAQILTGEVLEEIRLLLNFQLNDRFLLTLILLGQPDLQEKIDALTQLDQRIAIRAYLQPLTLEETADYVCYRVAKAGGDAHDIFSEGAFREIYVAAEGIPRRINTLCDFCFVIGAAQGNHRVDAAFVHKMSQDLKGNIRRQAGATARGMEDDIPFLVEVSP